MDFSDFLEKCKMCEKTMNPTSMKRHLSTIHGIGEYPGGRCRYCNKGFDSAVRHLNHVTYKHNKEEKTEKEIFKCVENDCKYVSTNLNYLKAHKKAMHSISNGIIHCKKYNCVKTFVTQVKAEKHETTHIIAKCEFCEKSYESARALKLHQKKKHTATDTLENHSFVMEENTDIDLLNEAVIINMSQDEISQFFMP